jgi:hypothetical protein
MCSGNDSNRNHDDAMRFQALDSWRHAHLLADIGRNHSGSGQT